MIALVTNPILDRHVRMGAGEDVREPANDIIGESTAAYFARLRSALHHQEREG